MLVALRIPDPLPLAVSAGVADIIPIAGGILATVPPVLVALTLSVPRAIAVLIALEVYRRFESGALVPRVYGKNLRLPGLVVLVALLVGTQVGGMAGAFFALPAAAALRAVLAYFRIAHHLPLLPLTVVGAGMSALGRTQLARLSGHLRELLSKKGQASAETLAVYIKAHPHWRDAITVAYSPGPLPSIQLFIAASIAGIPLRRFTLVWCGGVTIGDTFWVWTAGNVARALGDIFSKGVTRWQSVLAQIAGFAVVLLLFHRPGRSG